MPAQRAGYTVTIFLIDVSPSMGVVRTVGIPGHANGETKQTTNLKEGLKYVKTKVHEMIFNGRKTDQCGIILFGSKDTKNIVNEKHRGYNNVFEYMPVEQPQPHHLALIDEIEASTMIGDPVDALIVGIQTQAQALGKKASWTRKMVLLTDGENPIELDDESLDGTVQKIKELNINLSIIGVNFDEEDTPWLGSEATSIKLENEEFYQKLVDDCSSDVNPDDPPTAILGSLAYALQNTSRPQPKITNSTMAANTLRLGDPDLYPTESFEISIKTCKATSAVRPASFFKFAKRLAKNGTTSTGVGSESGPVVVPANFGFTIAGPGEMAPIDLRTEYVVNRAGQNEISTDSRGSELDIPDDQDDTTENPAKNFEIVEKDNLLRAYRYGASWIPMEEPFEKYRTKQGVDIVNFIQADKWNRDYSMGEVTFIFADPTSPSAQVALSSLVRAMEVKEVMAVLRLVGRDNSEPKMGVAVPRVLDDIDYLVFVRMPFAEDIRKFSFPSLDKIRDKKGRELTKHSTLPTPEMMEAMDELVDSLDLMEAGERPESDPDDTTGEKPARLPWFDVMQSFNPAVHRVKQVLFHAAVTNDIREDPLPEPHPELLQYFESPRTVIKRSKASSKKCIALFKVTQVQEKVKIRKQKAPDGLGENPAELMTLDDILGGDVSGLNPSGVKRKIKDEDDTDTYVFVDQQNKMDVDPKIEEPTPTGTPNAKRNKPSPPVTSPKAAIHDKNIKHGRIIGNTNPLRDFQDNASGNVIQAVADMGLVIPEIVADSFSSQRFDEALECMRAMRDFALKEDEIEGWNSFLTNFKKICHSPTFKHPDFWQRVQKTGESLSLIYDKEAAEYDATSLVKRIQAVQFLKD